LNITASRHTRTAPAKINLTLDVLPQREDGFHNIDSIVCQLSAGDEVSVLVRPVPTGTRSVRLTCNVEGLPTDSRNLATRAGEAFVVRFVPEGVGVDVRIKLSKRLPWEAGLGGGSSDAAAVLRLLDAALPGAATTEELRDLAATLGSDVPLFLFDGPVRMRGRGESVETLPVALPVLHGVVVKPVGGVATGPAYARLDATQDRMPGVATDVFLRALQDGTATDAAAIAPLLSNDFEQVVIPAHPDVAEAMNALLQAGALRALLCGSGAAVWGLARDHEHARELTRALVGKFPWVKMARTLGASDATGGSGA